MSELKQIIEQYKSAILKTAERRELWSERKKEQITETLKAIVKSHNIQDVQVQVLDQKTNYQGINLSFNKSHSGISEVNQNGGRTHVKTGGALVFHQTHTGLIKIFVLFPSIEDIVTERGSIILRTIEPDLVNDELIEDMVVKFFRKLLEFEETTSGASSITVAVEQE